MKIITVRQPWAHLIVSGSKNIENRTRPTKYRGPVLIHAAKARNADVCQEEGFHPDELERGCVIGIANIIDCVTSHRSRWFSGKYGYVLRNRRAIKPIPWTGGLGLTEAPAILMRRLPSTVLRTYVG
ncbi:MAG: ASCH domain-containing protein [Variibacter sp.]